MNFWVSKIAAEASFIPSDVIPDTTTDIFRSFLGTFHYICNIGFDGFFFFFLLIHKPLKHPKWLCTIKSVVHMLQERMGFCEIKGPGRLKQRKDQK